jgi:hypothetical protein
MSDHEDARRMLRDLLHEVLADAGDGNGHGPAPQVPAPPVPAVLRPSTWSRPAAPGEVIAGNPRAAATRTEQVTLDSDEDLDRFVRALLARAHTDGAAILAGELRFSLGGRTGSAADAVRVDHGAVTERTVKKAAAAGARLVLGPGAVLTPLAREKARALGVQIERERRC